jgi:hypothetical protein
MATEGGVREGWAYYANSCQGPRYNNTLFRGVVSVTGSAVVTLPLPIRSVVHALATLKDTAPVGTDVTLVTVGNYSGSSFTIYCWKATSSSVTTLIAATAAFPVEWMAWGTLPGAAAQGEVTA